MRQPDALKNDVQLTLNRATQLNEKLKLLEDNNEKEVNVKKIAQSSLRVALSTLDESINNNDEEALNESKDSISLGLQVIDVALSVTPVVSSAGEEYCRVFSRFTRDGVLDSNKVNKQGGIFVFRCADLINKSVKEIMDFLAIPEPPAGSTSYITKFVLPSGVSLFEGKANPLFGKVGQGMQILIDTQSKVLLEALENSDDQLLKGVFRGI